MKTYKLFTAGMLALLLLALTAAMLGAAPTDGGYGLLNTENVPIPGNTNLKAHSEAWNENYFDRNVATTLPFFIEHVARGQLRGGLAGRLPSDLAKPIVPKPGVKAHSDGWNTYYFDQTVNTNMAPRDTEYLPRGLRKGGLAK
jgi:hypothetical protein